MCAGGCNTSQATTAANPAAQAAYTDVVGKAQSVASTPYSPYDGELVAGLNTGQNTAVGELRGSYGAAQPYVDQGASYLQSGAQGLGAVQPYLQAGSDATAGAAGYQGLGAASFGQAAGYGGQSASALTGMQPYMDATQAGLGAAASTYGSAIGSATAAQGYYGQEASGLGQVGSYLGAASGMLGHAASLGTPQTFDSAAVGQYMSPYLSSVVKATQANLQENDRQQAEGLTSSAIGSGAYGGDRAGVAQAELARQQSLADGQTIAGLYNTGYSNAESQFNTVQSQRQAAAGLLNQGAGQMAGLGSTALQEAEGYGNVAAGYNSNAGTLAGIASGETSDAGAYNALAQDQGQMAQQYGTLAGVANTTGSGYTGLASNSLGQASAYGTLGQLQGTTGQAYGAMAGLAGNLGSTAQSNLISGASAGLQAATLRQQNAQQQDTANYNQYMAGLSYPYQNVGFLSNIVQGIGSQEGNTSTTQGNALSSIAGLGTSAIGILGATGGFGANGYLSSIGSTFSDERVKENVAPIGQTFDGQTMYRYNYKGSDPRDVKTGLMAQEVERRDPGSVGSIGGIKTVDYGRATAGAAALGLGARPGDPRPQRALGGPVGLGMSPVGGGTMPMSMPMGLGARPMATPAMATAGAGLGLGDRPHFDAGGAVDTGAAIPTGGGLSFGAIPGGGAGGLNTSPTGLMGGSTATAHAPQGLGVQRSNLATSGPTAPQFAAPVSFNGTGMAGLGDVSFSGGSASGASASSSTGLGASQDPSSSGFSPGAASGADGGGTGQAGLGANPSGGLSQNAWMGVMAAGLGMMGGTSASGLANVGQGALGGLKTYLGLQQQDKQTAYQQQELALRKQSADSEASYRTGTLAQGDKNIELKAQEMLNSTDYQRAQLGLQTQSGATQASAVDSENATRDQARTIGRYQQFYVPGDGLYVRDLTNPTAPPVRVGSGQGASSAPPASASPPSVSFNPPAPSAPPPQGGVPASEAAPPPASSVPQVNSAMPRGTAPAAAPTGSGAPGASAIPAAAPVVSSAGTAPVAATARPQAGSSMTPVQVPTSWQPTTTVPQGYVPANSMNIAMASDSGKSQAEIGQKQVEGLQTSAAKATNAQQQLYQMNAAIDALPKTGLIAPGALGDERAKLANSLNTIATTFGAQPVIDADKVANLQEVQKGAFRLGTQMITDTNGGREAGFILQNSVANVPSLNNNYLGFKRVASGIDQMNQYTIDKANFASDYYAKYHHTDGADALFAKLNPWQNYAQRAIDNSTMPTSRPSGVPQGSQYSMTARMWRGPDGSLYGQNGQAVQQ